jgi:hypothetical protein
MNSYTNAAQREKTMTRQTTIRTSVGTKARTIVWNILLASLVVPLTIGIQAPAQAAETWDGARMTFAKTNYANWTQQANQDRITTNVWLTRKNNQGLFNIATESFYTNSSPTNTEWAYGTTADLPLTFKS